MDWRGGLNELHQTAGCQIEANRLRGASEIRYPMSPDAIISTADSSPRLRGMGAAPAQPRYVCLDLWRGMACLMVVAVHATFFRATAPQHGLNRIAGLALDAISRMGVGVAMFFVISGYCIAATADKTRRRGRAGAQYFKRRLRRIFPPYWAALIVCVVAASMAYAAAGNSPISRGGEEVIPAPRELNAWQWAGNLTLTESWRYHLFANFQNRSAGARQLELGPAWTLCYEEQFYVVCGIALLAWPGGFFGILAGVTAIVLAMLPWATGRGAPDLAYYFFDGRWLQFAAGVLVYWGLNYTNPGGRRIALAILIAATLLAGGIRYGTHLTPDGKAIAWEYLVAMGFASLIFMLKPWDIAIATAPIFRPLQWCGQRCYSLYLVHYPIAVLIAYSLKQHGIIGTWATLLVTVPAVMVASLLAAWVFYGLVERHFLNAAQPAGSALKVPNLVAGTIQAPLAAPLAPARSQPADLSDDAGQSGDSILITEGA